MKYLVIIYGNQELWNSFAPDDIGRAIAEQDAYNKTYYETGELLGAYGLGDAAQASVVRVRDNLPAVTDGPYLETKEYLASFYMLDVESRERALELAALIPFASYNAVEVWPILHDGAEM
jgi:hypothetical protein